jgi:intein-encoded DNA endonuclease-like protein
MIDRARHLHQDGLSYRQIATRLSQHYEQSVTHTTVARWIKEP